jgi:fatty acid desaturase
MGKGAVRKPVVGNVASVDAVLPSEPEVTGPTDYKYPVINDQDLTEERREYLFPLPSFLEKPLYDLLQDKRDLVMVRLMGNIALSTVPAALFLFYMRSFNPWLGLLYVVATYVLYLQRFMLTLHFASHRKLFPKGNVLNGFSQYVLAPFFGLPSGTYYFHHVVMHHIENNIFPYDVSATMTYQRDNIFHFLQYWVRYVFAIWVQLPYYLFRRARYSLLVTCVAGQAIYLGGTYLLYTRVSAQATFWTIIVPYLVSSLLLMFGNFSQHIFVNPKNHEDSFNLTYNLINSDMNKLTYNDGYHIGHHVHSTLHWAELPNWFNRNIDKLAERGAFTFHTLDYAAVGFFVMTGQLEKLATYYVNIGPKNTHRTPEQVVATMKEWLKPIPI